MDYYTIQSTDQIDDEELERLIVHWIAGASTLAVNKIRPRWVPVLLSRPSQQDDWCAWGIHNLSNDGYPAMQMVDGVYTYSQFESLDILLSFYGPHSQRYIQQFRDNILLPLNNSVLAQNIGLTLRQFTDINPAPELIDTKWVRRYDITVTLNRKATRTYSINDIESAETIIRSN